MDLQLVCSRFTAPKLRLSSHHLFNPYTVSAKFGSPSNSYLSRLKGDYVCASSSNSRGNTNLKLSGREKSAVPAAGFHGPEPFRGKSGSVSFYGLTHQSVEERKLVSAPFSEDKGSFLWVLGPIALISSLIVPQFFFGNAIESFLKDDILVEIVASLSFEAMFYIGLATFLRIADRVQRPYLQFSPKRWGLITGLKGYLTSAFFVMGFKVIAPLLVAYVSWPVLRLPALVAVLPFLVGCILQRLFEIRLDQRGSSCWPLVPIIFEVYRIYQLTKAAHFIEKLMFSMRGLPESAQLLERNNALIVMLVTFQFLGVVCLWSFLTFLLRLFPSRPVAENY
ncbi:uncharacterized protein [Euphorbia lathyris]|uniref:uncharacterized protein n=1 Tax=Euphorbia lathyris TaxID=212925 RepID=UPI003313EE22